MLTSKTRIYWCFSISIVEKVKTIPLPGIEPGPCGWEPQILTTRPQRTHSLDIVAMSSVRAAGGIRPGQVNENISTNVVFDGKKSKNECESVTIVFRKQGFSMLTSETRIHWCFSISIVEKVKTIPLAGIEPGPCGWEPQILTTRPQRTHYLDIVSMSSVRAPGGSHPSQVNENLFTNVVFDGKTVKLNVNQ